ncbi:hypothetical protein HBH56_029630 [Parastagonospora nodorum]|uniref:Uncharacterized protein n=1 Tax=Phaeosphaeria nodorum (strain SN15 / ATCC MYA-4574 / FGSC 10173) TaxID=321614 RepID=A0A7U2F7R2_PHANO|nr:hypothetical protein HBH56_029630 [Parastagonospora nodorum]QRC99213.1 hypothetical protein JI435_436790 [Parastagonospora nodorum SN15]KAH3934612.1 hypothetical protein HBH54_052380 [Parastagonospora nodorum]KAH3985057.1 hypothetical protein HBH52_051210 [Parastagonospora nodorum]KAH4038940.1 hypothetical protein HBI09_041790 [Parastagonospora nodorum]
MHAYLTSRSRIEPSIPQNPDYVTQGYAADTTEPFHHNSPTSSTEYPPTGASVSGCHDIWVLLPGLDMLSSRFLTISSTPHALAGAPSYTHSCSQSVCIQLHQLQLHIR